MCEEITFPKDDVAFSRTQSSDSLPTVLLLNSFTQTFIHQHIFTEFLFGQTLFVDTLLPVKCDCHCSL
jgi:hypothetical protein